MGIPEKNQRNRGRNHKTQIISNGFHMGLLKARCKT